MCMQMCKLQRARAGRQDASQDMTRAREADASAARGRTRGSQSVCERQSVSYLCLCVCACVRVCVCECACVSTRARGSTCSCTIRRSVCLECMLFFRVGALPLRMRGALLLFCSPALPRGAISASTSSIVCEAVRPGGSLRFAARNADPVSIHSDREGDGPAIRRQRGAAGLSSGQTALSREDNKETDEKVFLPLPWHGSGSYMLIR